MTETEFSMEAFCRELQENPFSRTTRLIFADWCDEHDRPEEAKALRSGYVVLEDNDRHAIKTLKGCTFAPGTADKGFARNINAEAKWLTPRQYLWLWCLLRRYRRSVKDEVVKAEAERRYESYIALLDIGHLPSNMRMRRKKTDDRSFFLDDVEGYQE